LLIGRGEYATFPDLFWKCQYEWSGKKQTGKGIDLEEKKVTVNTYYGSNFFESEGERFKKY